MSVPRRILAVATVLAVLASACGDDSGGAGGGGDSSDDGPADVTPTPSDDAVESTTEPPGPVGSVLSRHLPDGYSGPAWPVPLDPVAGEHVNAIMGELLVDGQRSGETIWIPAGTAVEVSGVADAFAKVTLATGERAQVERDDLWRIGEFVEFKYIEVPINGESVPIGETGLSYHRVNVNNFDDRDTEEFDAIANNIRGYLSCTADRWKIANQYFAVDVVADGIYESDPELVAKGVTALHWGLDQELADDAVFSLHRDCDDTTARDYGETHHSSQWFAALGRGIFALAASPHAGEYRADIDRFTDHLLTLATYLTTDPVREHWRERWLFEPNGDVFTHKFYMRAAGLAAASALTDDPVDAARWSLEAREISEEGMAQQWDDGVNPERGGFDVRYQMYGTWLGIVYRSMLDTGDHRDELTDTINDAIAWIEPKLDPDTGQIDFEGSTRSCRPNSKVNEYHPYHMLSVYLLWAQVEPGNDHLYDLALHADAGHTFPGNACPQPAD